MNETKTKGRTDRHMEISLTEGFKFYHALDKKNMHICEGNKFVLCNYLET
jgi:hypothetical protein